VKQNALATIAQVLDGDDAFIGYKTPTSATHESTSVVPTI
jgi:hypothetical protein